MHLQCKLFFVLLLTEIAEVILDIVDEEKRGFDFAGTIAGGSFLRSDNIGYRPYTFTGELYQTKFGRW